MNFTEKQLSKYQTNYSDEDFWEKIKKFSSKMGEMALRPILSLYYVLQSPNTTIANKVLIIGALGYLILPFDIIPDFIPGLGLTDDMAAISAVIGVVYKHTDADVEQKVNNKLNEILKR